MSTAPNPRTEAAARAKANGYDSYPAPAQRSILEDVEPILHAADAADLEEGIHRIKIDNAAVDRVVEALAHWDEGRASYRVAAVAMIEALRGATR